MTYKELYDKALWDLEHDNMTLGEFDRITEPLNKEIPKEEQADGDLISRQAVLDIFGDIHPLDYNTIAYVTQIKELPSAEKTEESGENKMDDSRDFGTEGEQMTDGELISRTDLLEQIKKIINPADINQYIVWCKIIEVVENLQSAEKIAEVRPMQVELTEEIKEEIKQTLIQSNKDLSYALEDYDRGWLGGNLEIVRILEKHYGKFIDDDEIMKESEEEE